MSTAQEARQTRDAPQTQDVRRTQDAGRMQDARKLRVRNAALGLATVALALYFGFIALLVFRSHH